MTAPDLTTDEGRAALRQVGFWPRTAGLGLILGSAVVLFWNLRLAPRPDPSLTTAIYCALGLGWVLLVVAFLMRSRYQRRRLSDV